MKKASSDLILLDVNVLLALAWPNHQFHSVAHRRLADHRGRWATCVLTQLGFIRLSSNRALNPTATTPSEAASLLARMAADRSHVYLEMLPSPSGPDPILLYEKIFGTKQVTDAFLLATAQKHEATLVTFDHRLQALAGDDVKLEVLIG